MANRWWWRAFSCLGHCSNHTGWSSRRLARQDGRVMVDCRGILLLAVSGGTLISGVFSNPPGM